MSTGIGVTRATISQSASKTRGIRLKTYVAPLFITLIMTPLSAALACEAPLPPAIPDEGTSTLEEMVAAQVKVKSFQAANEGYLQCLDSRLSAA